MTFFCPNCSYMLGINKSIESDNDNRKIINTPTELIKLIKEKKKLNNYKAGFDRTELVKHKKYSEISEEEKKAINFLFLSNIIEAELKCFDCAYKKNITETILLHQVNKTDNQRKLYTMDDNKLLSQNPILPRTRDYKCINVKCPTHKDENLKEAVYYKDQKKYNINYICCACYFSWNNV